MFVINVLIWLGILIGIAGLLNKFAAKAPFFNGAYIFLCLAAVAAPIHSFAAWNSGQYEAAGSVFGSWLWPSILAFYLGRKFVAAHPFSFPSVLWHRNSTSPAIQANKALESEDKKADGTPS